MPYCETHPVRSGLVPCLIFECRVGLVFFLLFLKTCDYYASRMKLSLCQFRTSSNLFTVYPLPPCRGQVGWGNRFLSISLPIYARKTAVSLVSIFIFVFAQ